MAGGREAARRFPARAAPRRHKNPLLRLLSNRLQPPTLKSCSVTFHDGGWSPVHAKAYHITQTLEQALEIIPTGSVPNFVKRDTLLGSTRCGSACRRNDNYRRRPRPRPLLASRAWRSVSRENCRLDAIRSRTFYAFVSAVPADVMARHGHIEAALETRWTTPY